MAKEQENLVDFDEIEQLNKLGDDSIKQLERHAAINAGFHDYEHDSFVSKQMIRDICTQYQVFFENDDKWKKFLDQMKTYAELDPYTHKNYEKERKYVSKLPAMLEEMNRLLAEQEKAFRKEMNSISEKKWKKLSPKEQEKKNKEYILQQEVFDNRQRALASFEVYFETMTKGELEFMDDFDKKAKEKIGAANLKNGYNRLKLTNEEDDICYYISTVGVEMDINLKKKERNRREEEEYVDMSKYKVTMADMREAPLFPHEPRMTDVSQGYSGECYLYAALQDIARLYPQKIKNMIKDNGDGTATVRLYGKVTKNERTEYRPVYVRIEKTIPKIDGRYDRLGEDCLWVQLIEKAYAMSGMHDSRGNELNVPKDINSSKNKNWVPAISDIEGGTEYEFLETLLGPEGECEKVDVPDHIKIDKENKLMRKALDKVGQLKDVDMTNPEAIAKHAFYKYYKESGGVLSEADFQKEDRKEIVSLMSQLCNNGEENEYFDDAYSAIAGTAEKLLKKYEGEKITTKQVKDEVNAFLESSIEETTDKYKLIGPKKQAKQSIMRIYEKTCDGIFDMGLAGDVPRSKLKDSFYDKIWACTEMGLPVSCSTHVDKNMVVYADEKHAYSIIGAYKTEDVPPKYMFRIKNPHTKSENENGLKYTLENGEFKGEWVNVKDGIFDMQLEHFIRDFDLVHFTGIGALERVKHNKVEGYDLIKQEDVDKFYKNRLTTDKLTDYMKVSNDLYDMIVSTDSMFSHDSEAYKNLVEGIKVFRHHMAEANGREIKDLKKLTEPLVKLVDDYEEHIKEQRFRPSKRQKTRLNICKEIRKVAEAIDNGRNPETEYEKEYAAKLVNAFCDANNITDKSKIDEVSERMFNNKAFRTIANSTNIKQMTNPDAKIMQKHLDTIEKNLEGRGIDKGVDLATMKPRTEPKKAAVKGK